MFRFERRNEPLAPPLVFAGRLTISLLWGMGLTLLALLAGMLGYRLTEGMDWLDAYLNAAMLLGGMGPVDQMHTQAGKIFAGAYAMACGLIFMAVSGIVLAPAVHRVLHRLHAEPDGSSSQD